MEKTDQHLLSLLENIKGNGSFETSGVRPFMMPGLTIAGIGQVAFPMLEVQIKQIIEHARQAPFGKGSATITDTTVRNTWEIDAAELTFTNPEWAAFMTNIVERVQKRLSLENATVRADLYKLLIYEPGGFFLPHKDSEKAAGMFATLTIGLPAIHEGGELHVRFDGEEEIVEFAPLASELKIPYAAFFADCEHEIKPVHSGYRVCLVYNLIQEGGQVYNLSAASNQQREVTDALQNWLGDSIRPKAILLGHQYTPANFSLETLKHHDVPRAAALLQAAEQAGCYARLGLVTCYKMGDLIEEDHYYSRRRRRRYNDDDYEEESSEGQMGDDIYEEYIRIENWGEDELPPLGDIELNEMGILTDIDLMAGEPTEQEQEGFTGNAGMTIEYWYHYGAVVLWPKQQHARLLEDRQPNIRMQWLDFYLKNWQDKEVDAPQLAKQLLASFVVTEEENMNPLQRFKVQAEGLDYSPLAAALVQFKDEDFLKTKALPVLRKQFVGIVPTAWMQLLQAYKPTLFKEVFTAIGHKQDIVALKHLLGVLKHLAIAKEENIQDFVAQQLETLPTYLAKANLHQLQQTYTYYRDSSRLEIIQTIVHDAIYLQYLRKADVAWQEEMLSSLTQKMPRDYVNEVLVAVYLEHFTQVKNPLAKVVLEVGIKDLKKRTAEEPQPPADWTRAVPEDARGYHEVWKMLTPFLQSPTQQIFEYRKNESYRKTVESAIRNVAIDLRTETLRKGSPYTLKLIKTRSGYEREMEEWRKDLELLAACEG